VIAAIVSPDAQIREQIEAALPASSHADQLWTLAAYPAAAELTELDGESHPCILFLDFRDRESALRIARDIDRDYPRVTVVALNAGTTMNELAPLMQTGVREVLPDAFTAGDIVAVVNRVTASASTERARTQGEIFAFIPAKPGSGATTLVTHTAAAAARVSGRPALLIDFDLTLGITSFLLKQSGRHSVTDALMHSDHLDDDLWANLICERGNLHVLGSAPTGFVRRYSAGSCRRVLEFARQRYATVFVDVGGTFDDQESAAVEIASELFLVTTADMGGLHLGRRKCDHYSSLGHGGKMRILLNRVDRKRALSIADIEKILQAPVALSMNLEEDVVAAAAQAGAEIDWRSTLGSQIESLARKLTRTAATDASVQPRRMRRFVEYFSMSSARAEAECR
jgi:Flp pilus assembly CpaE family ATPase